MEATQSNADAFTGSAVRQRGFADPEQQLDGCLGGGGGEAEASFEVSGEVRGSHGLLRHSPAE
jgi:hypothetical protein